MSAVHAVTTTELRRVVMPYGSVLDDKELAPSALPPARGPLTHALFDLLDRNPHRARVVLPTLTEADDDPLLF
jgi:hypothetical protein